ncbi:MAG: indolepyruvate oxidoreductase subunit beta [Treponema sp.]|jgi:indolepyruvate ferredoxin oxidoreductase beta subunit|nr:indolepyruvate oxidoreductase subunit beta [Treponema sp.]
MSVVAAAGPLNCLITGVGGQGTVLLSRLIGETAIRKGMDVRGSETIGMAQRGGSVVSHLRIGPGVFSPLIPPGTADLIIAFECAEALRVLPFLAPTGNMLTLDRTLPPPQATASDPAAIIAHLQNLLAGRLTIVPWDDLLKRCGSPRVSNVALLGAAIARGFLPFSVDEISAVLKTRIPPRYLDMNLTALTSATSTRFLPAYNPSGV